MQRLCLVVLACLLIGGAGCRTRTEEPLTEVIRSPDYRPDSVGTVAYLGFAGGTSGEAARTMMEDLVEQRLLASQEVFVVLPRDEISRRARAEGVEELLGEVRDFWRGSRKIDKLKTGELCAALGTRAVVVGVVEDWIETGSARGSSESPYSRVAATLEIYSAETGRRLWKARSSQTLEARALEGSLQEEHEGTVRGRERMRSNTVQATQQEQQAPAIEGVAGQVAGALDQALRGN